MKASRAQIAVRWLAPFTNLLAGAALVLLAAQPAFVALANKSPVVVVTAASVLMLAAAIGSGSNVRLQLFRAWVEYRSVVLFGALASLWCALSLAWSLDPGFSAIKMLQTLSPLLIIPALVAGFPLMRTMLAGKGYQLLFILFFALAIGIVIVEQHTGLLSHIKGNEFRTWEQNAAAQFLAVAVWPVLWLASRLSWFVAGALYAGLLYAIMTTDSQAAQLILITGVAGLPFAMVLRKISRYLYLATSLVIYLIGLGIDFLSDLIFAYLPRQIADITAADARLSIWSAFLEGALERPLVGWGLYTSQLPAREPYNSTLGAWADAAGHHAHNLALTLFFELGIVGLFAGAIVVVLLFSFATRAALSLQPFIFMAIVSALLNMSVGRYIWLSAWFISLIIFVYLFVLLSSMDGRFPIEKRRGKRAPHR